MSEYDEFRSEQVVPCPGGTLYTIRAGDTLYALAQRFGTTVDAILAANPGLDPMRLRIGQQICVPGATGAPCPAGTTPYIIRSGDTFYSIAQRFNISVAALIAANPGVDPNRLRIGQIICVPAPTPPPVVPRTCVLALTPRSDGPAPESGGVLWLRRENRESEILVAAMGLPAPITLDANRYTAAFTWGRTTFDLPLFNVRGLPGVWVGVTEQDFPEQFFTQGSVDIFPGPVMGGVIEDCR